MFVKKSLVALLLLLLTAAPVISFAAEGGSARFNLVSPMLVADTEVAAGKYDVQWSPDGEILFKAVGKPNKIAVKGKIEELPKKLSDNSMGIGKDASGKSVLKRLDFKGKKVSVRVTFE